MACAKAKCRGVGTVRVGCRIFGSLFSHGVTKDTVGRGAETMCFAVFRLFHQPDRRHGLVGRTARSVLLHDGEAVATLPKCCGRPPCTGGRLFSCTPFVYSIAPGLLVAHRWPIVSTTVRGEPPDARVRRVIARPSLAGHRRENPLARSTSA